VGAVEVTNVSAGASLQTNPREEEFSESARVLSEEFRRHGFSGGALLALQVGQHGKEWALQTLQLAFYGAIYDAEERLDFRANFNSVWDSLPDSPDNHTVEKVPRRAEGLKMRPRSRVASNVAQYVLYLVIELGGRAY
jgi:hypothetical protein